MPDRSEAIVQGPNLCEAGKPRAALERVGHPIKLLSYKLEIDICAGRIAVSLGSWLGCRGVYKPKKGDFAGMSVSCPMLSSTSEVGLTC